MEIIEVLENKYELEIQTLSCPNLSSLERPCKIKHSQDIIILEYMYLLCGLWP